MFKKILLPVDLTDRHQAALATARDLARFGGEVVLLHVIEVIPGLAVEEDKEFYARLDRSAREHLAALTAALRAVQVPCRYEVILGNRARETVRYATTHGHDLILVTAPTFHPDNPASGLGSLVWKISLMAPCPILLVKPPAQS